MPHQQAEECYIKQATLTDAQCEKVNRFCSQGGSDGKVQYFDAEIPQEVGVTAQQAIERTVREEKLAGKGKLKVKMVLTGEGTSLRHVVEGEIDLSDADDI